MYSKYLNYFIRVYLIVLNVLLEYLNIDIRKFYIKTHDSESRGQEEAAVRDE